MTYITDKQVIVASLYLPLTIEIELKDRKRHSTETLRINNKGQVPNLLQTLAQQQKKKEEDKKDLFDCVQPERTSTDIEPSLILDNCSWFIKQCSMGNIGLNNSIYSIQEQTPHLSWVGTLGISTDTLSDDAKERINVTFEKAHQCYPIIVSDAVFDGHYNIYCKQILWPYFHYVVQDVSQNRISQDGPWQDYKALNRLFSDRIIRRYREGDIIWINDYHLMLVPGMIRESIPNAIIGFFLHIPFPSSELFRCLPTRKELLWSILQSNVVGFQTYSFARHFLQTCSRILLVNATPSGIQLDTHYCSVGIDPIGIDVHSLNQKITDPIVTQWVAKLREKYAGKKLIVARDKLDFIKGVRQKMLAFEQFLTHYPQWRGEVVMIQIALSTSEQNELQVHISDVVSSVNSKFSNISYQPIVFLHQDISFVQYLALLICADACLLTPLRDGMNLTSHEYIVCQSETHNPLILSEFTGTYGSFGASLRVNPWDYRQVGDAIHESLSMGQSEKTYRWKELYKSIQSNSAQHFAQNIIKRLIKADNTPDYSFNTKKPQLNADILKTEYRACAKKLFLFDYGGTLIPHGKPPGSKDIDRVLHVLHHLTNDSNNAVYVISGRTKFNIDMDLGSVPNLGLSAENGYYIKLRGGEWQKVFDNIDFSWKPTIKEIFQYYTERTPGAYVESKDTSIVWHYKQSADKNSQYISWQAAECQNHIADSVNENFAVQVKSGRTTIEVVPHDINKTSIAKRILEETKPEFVLSVGDDRSNEDLFSYLNKQDNIKVVTATVGTRSTKANYYIPNVDSVFSILDQLQCLHG
ncbi:glycosyltransferase family 20-domain-containing protein [Pilobolus umbonatus]|nr:glycosyltransferase family 20-domain-containing protein [Pilobolus umbonatus]